MKKLITLIAGLLLVALPVGLAGCDDSDKEIYNDGRLVTDVVIPTSMTVYRGMFPFPATASPKATPSRYAPARISRQRPR